MTEAIGQEQKKEKVSYREELILASILYDPECRAYYHAKHIDIRLFQSPRTRQMIQAFNDVSKVAEPTKSLLLDQLNPKDEQTKQEILQYLHKLNTQYEHETLDSIQVHVRLLKKIYKNAMFRQMGNKILTLTTQENLRDLTEKNIVESYVEETLFHLSKISLDEEEKKTSYTLTEGIQTAVKQIDEFTEEEATENVTTGYKRLDEALDGGFKRGTFALIAARPGMGKTVWMLNSAVEAAKKGVKTLFVSVEMPAIQLFQRVLSKISKVPMSYVQRPINIPMEHKKSINSAAKKVAEVYGNNFFVEEVSELNISQLERIVKHYTKTHQVESVYVDYAQILQKRNGDRPENASDFGEISGGLRIISKKLNVAMVVGSQLNREVEKREDKRPIMSDIRNAGEFEQDAAIMIGLYRDEVYNKETSEKPNTIELIFMKNRFGQANQILDFKYDLSRQNIMSEAPVPTAA